MGPYSQTYPPWEIRPTYPTHHAYALPSADRPEQHRSALAFLVAIVGFALAFGGTLVWRAHLAHAQPTAATMTVEAPSQVVPGVVEPSAFEPPPPTIALSAAVGEPPPPLAAVVPKAEKRRKAKTETAKVVHASPVDSSAALASAENATRKHGRKSRRLTAD